MSTAIYLTILVMSWAIIAYMFFSTKSGINRLYEKIEEKEERLKKIKEKSILLEKSLKENHSEAVRYREGLENLLPLVADELGDDVAREIKTDIQSSIGIDKLNQRIQAREDVKGTF